MLHSGRAVSETEAEAERQGGREARRQGGREAEREAQKVQRQKRHLASAASVNPSTFACGNFRRNAMERSIIAMKSLTGVPSSALFRERAEKERASRERERERERAERAERAESRENVPGVASSASLFAGLRVATCA